jgi:ABC-type multidrug transport system fused ATPase/permease subunit
LSPTQPKKKTGNHLRGALPLLKELVRPRRGKLAVGFLLMTIGRLCSLVLPGAPKFLIDNVINQHQVALLKWIVGAVFAATIIQGITSFSLTQLLSKEGQRLIAELRCKVQEHIGRLPVAYYDANKSGALVSRIMSDVEGVRNLIGTGLVEFVGGIMTSLLSLFILLRISARLTGIALFFVIASALGLAMAFGKIRPIFRERGKINADVTGRLTESLAGVRVVKGYHAEAGEARGRRHRDVYRRPPDSGHPAHAHHRRPVLFRSVPRVPGGAHAPNGQHRHPVDGGARRARPHPGSPRGTARG